MTALSTPTIADRTRRALTGPIASLRTPFNRDGSIDFAGMKRQIDFVLAAGAKATLITAGDSHLLCMTDQEVLEVHRVAAEHTAGRVLVVGADWEYATPRAVEFARDLKAMGVDVLMVRPPDWSQSATADLLVAHYRAVARVMPVMVVTNVFQGRPESFGLKVLAKLLADEPGVIALKEDLQNEFARRSALLVHPRWTVFSAGGLRSHLNMVHFGCDGFMDRHLNFAPRVTERYWDAVKRRDWDAAVAVIQQVELPLEEHMGEYPGSRDAAIHGLLEVAGVCGRWRRPPYHSLTDAEMAKLGAFTKQLRLFE
jgi:4-hydroxy-tetrahydrodipicolinate synthase